MKDNKSQVVAATLVGAVLGGLAGFIFFTERGRRLHRALEPALDGLTDNLDDALRVFDAAAGVASEGWKLFSEAMGDSPRSRS